MASSGFPILPFLAICFALLLSSTAHAQSLTVQPSNNSDDLPRSTDGLTFELVTRTSSPIPVTPLLHSFLNQGVNELTSLNLTGTLVNVSPSNSGSIVSSDLALISCDDSAYSGLLGADDTLKTVVSSQVPAAAVVLYSLESSHCNLSTDMGIISYRSLFTLVNIADAQDLQNQLDVRSGGANIVADPTSTTTGITSSSSSSSSSSPSTGGTPNNGASIPGSTYGGSPPTTQVAMIILYSITAIITALFLAIIVTGAVRAHRNPERYGPRSIVGRARQSRAKGIARAMLDTIPIVKFGDQEDKRNEDAKGDLEMGSSDDLQQNVENGAAPETSTTNAEPHTDAEGERKSDGDNAGANVPAATAEKAAPQADAVAGSSSSNLGRHADGALGCSICTDDFVKGQDIRVLPCSHKFHPDCVDPWLVNVSGTCPLCRIDLNPPEEEAEATENSDTETLPPPLGESNAPDAPDAPEAAEGDASGNRHRHRISAYIHHTLNARRMRDASVEERIATLRSIREENQTNTAAGPNTSQESVGQNTRLATRLRDRFRIRTRRHEEQPSQDAGAS